jgi:anti-sigma factor RsiW
MKGACSLSAELLERYMDSEMTDRERGVVETHLAECPSCSELLRSMMEFSAMIKVPAAEHPSNAEYDRLWRHIKNESQKKRAPRFDFLGFLRQRIWVPASAVALVLVIVAASLLFKKTTTVPGRFGVEYVESKTNNVVVYEVEKSNVTVIWLLEGPEEDSTPASS